MKTNKRISAAKYATLKPVVVTMSEQLCTKLQISFSALVARLLVEAHSKAMPEQHQALTSPKQLLAPAPQTHEQEINPLD